MRKRASRRTVPDSDSRLLFGWEMPVEEKTVGFTARVAATRLASPTLISDRSESHVLVVAPTGAGKGRNFIIPNLLTCENPAIVLDIKGEAARVTARRRREMGHEVVILDPFHIATQTPASLNPLTRLAANPDTVADEAFALAALMSEGHRFEREAFWDDLAEGLLGGLFVHVATSRGLKSRALGDVWDLLASSDFVYSAAVLLDTVKGLHPFAYQQLATFLQHEGDKVRTSVRSVAQQHMRIFASSAVQKSVATTSFDIEAVRSGAPMTIYIVVPPTKIGSHGPLLRLWLATLLNVIRACLAPQNAGISGRRFNGGTPRIRL